MDLQSDLIVIINWKQWDEWKDKFLTAIGRNFLEMFWYKYSPGFSLACDGGEWQLKSSQPPFSASSDCLSYCKNHQPRRIQ